MVAGPGDPYPTFHIGYGSRSDFSLKLCGSATTGLYLAFVFVADSDPASLIDADSDLQHCFPMY
jgi:hypothetical protein